MTDSVQAKSSQDWSPLSITFFRSGNSWLSQSLIVRGPPLDFHFWKTLWRWTWGGGESAIENCCRIFPDFRSVAILGPRCCSSRVVQCSPGLTYATSLNITATVTYDILASSQLHAPSLWPWYSNKKCSFYAKIFFKNAKRSTDSVQAKIDWTTMLMIVLQELSALY